MGWCAELYVVAAVFSTIGAWSMTIVSYRALQSRQSNMSELLFYVAISDLIFTAAGLIKYSLTEIGMKQVYVHQVIMTIHYAFEIASFKWSAALGLYMLYNKPRAFPIRVIKWFIWTTVGIWTLLTIMDWKLRVLKCVTLAVITRVGWDLIGMFTILCLATASLVHGNRYRRTNSTAKSVIVSRLRWSLVAFCVCVVPSFVRDIDMYTTNPQVYSDNFDIVDFIHDDVYTLFTLLPLANSFIYLFHWKYIVAMFTSPRDRSSIGTVSTAPTSTHQSSSCITELHGLELGGCSGSGLAVVYRGKWRGVEVAVKCALTGWSCDTLEGYTCELQKEAKLMKSLSHPNIVLFMEVGLHNGSVSIVSEYCANGSLRDILEEPQTIALFWPMKIRLALGIAQGLQYLHSCVPALIHRDLKSPNIVVDASWHAKIADFGTSRLAELVYHGDRQQSSISEKSKSIMTGLIGTTRWMSPEVIRQEKIYTESIDIYSFGMVMWEMIEGKLPYENEIWNTKIEQLILDGYVPPVVDSKCPELLSEL